MPRTPVSILLLGAMLVAGPRAQEEAPRVPCRSCESRGEKDCKRHRKDVLALERAVRHCSVAADCSSCGGALTTDCRTCTNPQVERAMEKRAELAAKWCAERRTAVDEFTTGQPMVHIQTRNVDLTFSVKPLTVGRSKLDTHRLAHLYAQRIEELRAMYLQIFEVRDRDFSARLQVFLFRDRQDHSTMGPRVAGGGGGGVGQKLMGSSAVYSMYHDLRTMPNDEELHRAVVHNVAHLLVSNMAPAVWLGNRKHGWVDAGVAHWFEDRITGKCTNFCYEEVALTGAGFKGGRWRAPVRKMVDAGNHHSFAELATRNTDQLEFADHALAFAYTDFLIAAHGGGDFCRMVRLLKRGRATREALREALGRNILTIDEAFKAWVQENYSLRVR